jgi:peroxiredoxin
MKPSLVSWLLAGLAAADCALFVPMTKAESPAFRSVPVAERGVVKVGEEAPNFQLRDLAGNMVTLSQLRGKVVLLNFWATWCGPCRFEMPVLERLQKEFRKAGLVVFGVNDEEPGTALNYLKRNRITFKSLVDSEQKVSILYQVRAIPTVIIVDREGKIAFHGIGLTDEAALRNALNKAGISKR